VCRRVKAQELADRDRAELLVVLKKEKEKLKNVDFAVRKYNMSHQF
jgi:hypothetical protein